MSNYQVFTLEFASAPVHHKAIFVVLRGAGDDGEGPLLHVKGLTVDPKAKKATMHYENKTRKASSPVQ